MSRLTIGYKLYVQVDDMGINFMSKSTIRDTLYHISIS